MEDKKESVKFRRKKALRLKTNNPNTVTNNRLYLLVTVVDRKKTDFYQDLIQSFGANMQLIAMAEGTANDKMLGYLGLSGTAKSVIFSVVQESKVDDLLNMLENKFKTIKDGKGIAFTVKLTSVIGTLIFGFLSDNRAVVNTSGKEKK